MADNKSKYSFDPYTTYITKYIERFLRIVH